MNPDHPLDLKIEFEHAHVFNFSLQQNHIPVIYKFIITNLGEVNLQNLGIRITSEPEFVIPFELQISSIQAGESYKLDDLDLKLSTKFLSELTERMVGTLRLTLLEEENTIFQNDYSVDILAFDQWQGLNILPELLASFITPNNPQISKIVTRASEILYNWTNNPSFDEYQSRTPDRVKKQMAAVFEAIHEQAIVYCAPPASFEESGQRIRMVDTVLSQKLGTCLDLSLLYASCLEAIGINPLIAVIKGHAFSGGWLVDESFADSTNDDPTLLSKRTAEGINEILLVESTFMTAGKRGSFDDCIKSANSHLTNTEDFLLFVDIKRSRFAGIRPLPQRIRAESGWELIEEGAIVKDIVAPAEIITGVSANNNHQFEVSKQLLWERKLLDLSLRNNLLNTRITKSTLQLISLNLSKLEDALSASNEFQLLPKPTDWENPYRRAGVYQALHQADPIIDLVNSEMSQGRLRTYLPENELVHGLTNLYRSSRLSLEENGANTLYLSLGLLRWFETPNSEQPRVSPILLLPVEIIRKSAAKGFILRSREEETLVNITLLEMLRQDYKITIPGLDPLPRDESGVDVKTIFNIIRQAIMQMKRWDVEEQAILGTFSFSKFIMWNDIHNNADKLIQNKIVSSLITGKAQWDVKSNQFSEEELDTQYHPSDISLPISADSSQLEAICAASQNKSFVLHGPPGTGKSQTITNIIANALYQGKKVLFVAEKMAALSVVQKRLESIGIAPFCLELHSNKSKKSSLLEQLKRTTEIIKKSSPDYYYAEAEKINQLRNELNNYVEALHKKYPFGFSLFEAFSAYIKSKPLEQQLQLDNDVITSLTEEKINTWIDLAEEMQAAGQMCGRPHNHPLRAVQTSQYSSDIKSTANNLLDQHIDLLNKLGQSANEMKKIIHTDLPVDKKQHFDILNEIGQIILSSSDLPSDLFSKENTDEIAEIFIQLSDNGLRRDKYRTSLLSEFKKDILTFEANKAKDEWDIASAKWFLPKFFGQNKIINTLKTYAIGGKFDRKRADLILQNIIELQKEQEQIDQKSHLYAPLLGSRWNGGDGDWREIEQVCRLVKELNQLLSKLTNDNTPLKELKTSFAEKMRPGYKQFLSNHSKVIQDYLSIHKKVEQIGTNLCNLLIINPETLPPQSSDFVQNSLYYSKLWKSALDSLRDWVSWNQTRNKVNEAGLEQLSGLFEEGSIEVADIVNLLKRSIYRGCADYIISQENSLSSFNGKLFNERIRKFRQLNRHFEDLTKDELFAKLASKIPSFALEASQSSEIGILQRNMRNGGRGMSIRKLFDSVPNLITRIAPCMLMSPISVAQYIDINNFKFDLIVFDEASQMPTCEAVGAIARGGEMIVVGDPNQMPPTNFFSSNNIDEENIENEDLESILDDCLALSLPSKHLQWHYRSRHESLIAFSNAEFYENKLLTFPSPDDLTTKVKFVQVPGYYDRGKTRQNSFEAKAVIDEIMNRLQDPELSLKSIGVVTFSSVQQILIDDMLTEAFKLRPELEIIASESSEPIFIKNLENVQGDERDIILFSVGYGPDKENRVNLNFGPLNREGGWRRLNVAVSRARYEMKVFSTLTADQIDITRSSSRGVASLKAFLMYAEKGSYSFSNANINKLSLETGVADSIATKLRDEGFNVKTNIGCSGFKIDIAITNPELPNEYLLGILCDGHSYKEAKTARDREIIQSDVLRQLGWNIHRVWSCDWWDDQEKILTEIRQTLQQINSSGELQKTVEPKTMMKAEIPPVFTSTLPMPDFRNPSSNGKLNYLECVLSSRSSISIPNMLTISAFHNTVRSDIKTVLDKEAPISKELLIRRVLTAWSVTRVGLKLEAYFEDLFDQMKLKHTDASKRFYWNENQNPQSYQYYRVAANDSTKRDATDISPEEISNVVREVLINQISLNRADLIKESARILGFNRTGGNIELAMKNGIAKAIQRGYAKIEGDRVYHVD